jgi:hypothetical protein
MLEISNIDNIIENIILQNNNLLNTLNNGLFTTYNTKINDKINIIPETQRLIYFNRLLVNLKNNLIKCNRDININITARDLENIYVKQKGKCALSKTELTFNYSNRKKKYNNSLNKIKIIKEINDFNISISRLDNNKEYTTDNIQLIACRINLMKNNLSNKKFIELCEKVVKNYNIYKKISENVIKNK